MNTAMSRVLDIIREEHRSIRVVLDGLRYLAQSALTGRSRIDAKVFRAMLHYLETYAERLHHPKEDQYLFAAMRQYGPKVESVIERLERDHASGERALRDLDHRLARCEEDGEKRYASFVHAVEDFARDYLEHMRREEEEVFPLALELLAPQDWETIDRAFEENRDPLASIHELRELKDILERIVRLAPPPVGTAPAVRG